MSSVLIVLVGILMFGLLIAVHEFGHFITAKLCGVKVNEFAIGMGPKLWSRQGAETLYSLRLFPIGGYCAMEGEDEDTGDPRSFQKAKAWKRFLILVAGAFMNFLVGFLLYLVLCGVSPQYIAPVVDDLLPDFTPTSQVHLEPGDQIVEIDGHPIYLYTDVQLFFSRGGDDLELTVIRDGERLELGQCHMPYYEHKGAMVRGVNLKVGETTPRKAVELAWLNSVDTVRLVWLSLGDLFSGVVGIRDMSGPVGIVSLMGDVATQAGAAWDAFLNILNLVAFIAVNLAVMNLLPIPALDGGRVLFLIVNLLFTAITKKRLDPKYEGVVNAVFLVALLAFMLVVSASDILKLFGR